MKLSEDLQWRGQVKDRTFGDITWLDTPQTFYLGVDCNSSSSMTVGNLAVFILARRLLDAGWKTVLLVGGATSLIGDPGGKDDERPLISREQVANNVAGISAQVQRLFDGQAFTLVDNFDWFKDIGYLEFLRDVGKHFSMTELVQRDYIASRIGEGGSGISYAEFSYSLIQGYDYWHLYKKHGVVLQIGGSDQWGNMLSGVPLIRKKEGADVHALSAPLVINKATGKKFGKSEDGAVWLDEQLTSVYKFYQFWLNVDDEAVIDYLKIYTLRSPEDIEEIIVTFRTNPGERFAQKTLAYEVTKLVHGAARADSVRRITEVLFGKRNFADLEQADTVELAGELPVCPITEQTTVHEFLVQSGLAGSMSDARRLMASGAVSVNGTPIDPGQNTFDMAGSAHGYLLVRRGKNQFALAQV